jgi:hypothetical protein
LISKPLTSCEKEKKNFSFSFRVLVSLSTRYRKQIVFIMMLILGAHVLLSLSLFSEIESRIAVALSVKNRCNHIVLQSGQLTYVHIHFKRIGIESICLVTVRQNIISKKYAIGGEKETTANPSCLDASK